MRCGIMILLVFVSVAAAASTRMQADVSGFGAARPASRGPDQGADPFRVSVRAAWRGEPDAELTRGAFRELAEVWTENGVHVGPYAEELSSEPHAAATVTLMLAQAPGPAVPRGALGWI
jgi:hypothetical protein